MPVRTRVLSEARQRSRWVRFEIGSAIRQGRFAAGLRLADIARVVDRSASWVSRVERGLDPTVGVDELVLLGAAAGVKVWMTTFPGERAIRDAPQLALLRRFRARIGETWHWSYEVVVPVARDRRAADAVIRHGSTAVMIEAFTRLGDAQAQLRLVGLKARDMGITRVVIVVAATHTNRSALRLAAEVLAAEFPLETRQVLRALSAGRDPGANGIVLI